MPQNTRELQNLLKSLRIDDSVFEALFEAGYDSIVGLHDLDDEELKEYFPKRAWRKRLAKYLANPKENEKVNQMPSLTQNTTGETEEGAPTEGVTPNEGTTATHEGTTTVFQEGKTPFAAPGSLHREVCELLTQFKLEKYQDILGGYEVKELSDLIPDQYDEVIKDVGITSVLDKNRFKKLLASIRPPDDTIVNYDPDTGIFEYDGSTIENDPPAQSYGFRVSIYPWWKEHTF
eukprot:TRINITY_DN112_c0_g2_i1.p1 TRINITY_DN112_c0_g2~~TRINITY_DN112_c0_g2_i1.p1  ORF type:complete len:273 (+),score=80.86 TRINITY_DN112_c0_g2_i1:121-819(+)